MEYAKTGDSKALTGLMERAAQHGKGAAPVEQWNPPYCGDLDMEIRGDGSWWYLGTPIGRPALVQLFSSVLRKDEDGKTFLVTPVEKVGIRVADAHFIAVEMVATGSATNQILNFRTNAGDVVEAGPHHELRFAEDVETGGIKPYVRVRGRLEALISRAVTYQLLELGEEINIGGKSMLAIRSSGSVFPIMELDRLAALME